MFSNSGITTLPVDIFRYNILCDSFEGTFQGAELLETVPANLFKYNTLCTNFFTTFSGCNKLQENKNIFYADGEQGTRFLNQSVNFKWCLDLSGAFAGTQGGAPDLWNCDFGSGTVDSTQCWGYHDGTSLSNYASIPVGWK